MAHLVFPTSSQLLDSTRLTMDIVPVDFINISERDFPSYITFEQIQPAVLEQYFAYNAISYGDNETSADRATNPPLEVARSGCHVGSKLDCSEACQNATAAWSDPKTIFNCMSYPVFSAVSGWTNLTPTASPILSNYGFQGLNQTNLSSIIMPMHQCIDQYCESVRNTSQRCYESRLVFPQDFDQAFTNHELGFYYDSFPIILVRKKLKSYSPQ